MEANMESDPLKSESENNEVSSSKDQSKFCEFANLVIFSLINVMVISILFIVFKKPISEKYLKAISNLESENFEGILVISFLFILFEILMVPGSLVYTVCGFALN